MSHFKINKYIFLQLFQIKTYTPLQHCILVYFSLYIDFIDLKRIT